MPLEFALRPRIRMREDPPPRAPSRRSRLRVPRFALPAALYWAAMGGICYGIIRLHDAPSPEPAETRELAQEPELPSVAAPSTDAPALQAAATEQPIAQEAPAPSPEPSTVPSMDEPRAEPQTRTHALGEDVSAALLATQEPRTASEPRARQHTLGRQAEELADNALPPLDSSPERAPEPRPAALVPRSTGSSLPSCEAAAAAAVQDMDFASSDRSADLPSEAIAGVLENGAWFSSCSLPSSTKLDVCVAIKGGRVTAATVTSRPFDPALNACVKQRAAALQFPYSTRVDVARTRF